MANVYIVDFPSKLRVIAENEDEAKEIYMRMFSLGKEDLKVTFVTRDESPFVKKHSIGIEESQYLDTGVTRGIV